MVSRVIPVEDFDLIIFGATGDLSRRKIMPGLFRRFVAGQIPPGARVIGSARSAMTADEFRADVRAAIAEHDSRRADHPQLDEFLARLDYIALDATDRTGAGPAWQAIRDKMRDGVIRAAYFLVAPFLFEPLARGLAPAGRMALSNYLMQSVVCAFLFTGWGLRLSGSVSPGVGLLIAVAIFLAQLPLSAWWLRRHAYGPVEWLLRALTIGAWPAWRRQPAEQAG